MKIIDAVFLGKRPVGVLIESPEGMKIVSQDWLKDRLEQIENLQEVKKRRQKRSLLERVLRFIIQPFL